MKILKLTQYFTFIVVILAFSSCSKSTVITEDNFDVVELPDGSIAYLNFNSSLKYDQEFSPKQVDVSGEVYLSVSKMESPFFVNTELGKIKVLGTDFNVKSSDNELNVEVENGSVELITKDNTSEIKKGEGALYKKGEKSVQKFKAEFKFKSWMKSLKIEFKKLGKEIKSNSKETDKESKKIGKEVKKEFKKLKIK